MASVVLMVGGVILNAAAFIGGNYLAKMFGGSDADEERKRHDKALEKYQADYAAYEKKRQQFLDWIETQRENKDQAEQNLEDTDNALKLYNEVHPDSRFAGDLEEPRFSDYFRPSPGQKSYELVFVGSGMLLVGYLGSRFL